MYAQTFFVTSVRGNVFAPQIATNAGLRVFGAKMPFPAFFIAAARLSSGLHRLLPRSLLLRRHLLQSGLRDGGLL